MQQYENSLPDLFLHPSGLARLKKFGVEDLSEVAMADQIRKLQIQMARVHDDLQYHTEDIIEIRRKFNKHLSGHSTSSTNSSPSSAVPTSSLVQSLSTVSTVSSKVSPKRLPGIHSNSASSKPFMSGGLFPTSFPSPSLTPSGVKFGVPSTEPSPSPMVDPDPKQPSAPPVHEKSNQLQD